MSTGRYGGYLVRGASLPCGLERAYYAWIMAQLQEGAAMDWADCHLVEVVPGKVSGVPLLKGTRRKTQAAATARVLFDRNLSGIPLIFILQTPPQTPSLRMSRQQRFFPVHIASISGPLTAALADMVIVRHSVHRAN